MSRFLSSVDPVDRAILKLLCGLLPRWGRYDPDELTNTEQQAIHLMVQAGLIEIRLHIRAQMDQQPESLEMTVIVSGQYDARTLWRTVLRQVPHWFDSEGRTLGQCRLWLHPQQVRLTDQGELARHDFEHQTPENPSAVCAFVRRTGFFATRPDVAARIRVEHAECSSTVGSSASASSGTHLVAAQATAKACIGDITVQNHITVDAGQVAEAVIAMLKDQPQSEHTEDRGGGEPGTGHQMSDELAASSGLDSTQYGGPIPDPYDDRVILWMGKHLYLGRNTQLSRLFWLLAKPPGRARSLDEVQVAVDGMATNEFTNSTPEEIMKADRRMRKAVSKLRTRLRQAGFDDHIVIHYEGGQECSMYTMILRYGGG